MDRARGELRALTGLRGVAAWSVVVFHLRMSLSLPGWGLAAASHLYLAVDLFFALSGFVIWLAWSERLREGGAWSAASFLLRRLARLWPLYALVLAASAALAIAFVATGRAHPDRPWPLLPLHLLLVQGWGVTDRLAWNDPDWSVSCEWAAYLLTPLLAATLDWRRVRTPALLLALAAMPLVLAGAMHLLGAEALGEAIPRTGLTRCLLGYLAGTMLAELWRRGATGLAIPTLAAVALFGLALEPIATASGAILLLLALATLGCGMQGNPLEARAPVALGRWSYATYLIHYPLWTIWKLAAVPDSAHPGGLVLAAYAITLLAFSWAAHAFIEQPTLAAANARIDRALANLLGPLSRRRTPPAASR